MSDQIIRQYPFVTPDSMRQKTHIDKNFFDAHTKKAFGRTHTNGTKYVGHVENWGSEMLLESRKMKTNRPPLGDIILNERLNQFFELRYDDNINTYEHENAFMCLLKKDVIKNSKIYIKFNNVEKYWIPRAMEDNDLRVFPQLGYRTKTPPILYYEEYDGGPVLEYELSASNKTGGEVTYWFLDSIPPVEGGYGYNQDANSYFDIHADNELDDILLDVTYKTDDSIQTLPLMKWMEGLPFIWLTFSNYQTLPPIIMNNNITKSGGQILIPGTDGNGHHFLYLNKNVNGDEIQPHGEDHGNDGLWQLRVYAKNKDFSLDASAIEENFNKELDRLVLVYYNRNDTTPGKSVENYYEHFNIVLSGEYYKLMFPDTSIISNFYQTRNIWKFHKPEEGDWDYDGVSYQNTEVYAYLDDFGERYTHLTNRSVKSGLSAIFQIIPNLTYIDAFEQITHDRYDWLKGNSVAGVHVDYTTDYSTNGVIKNNGSIFKLGDYDGLPPYYHYKLPRTTHRPHVELYGIRDKVREITNKGMENQTASVIVDGAIPRGDMDDLIKNMEPAIKYDMLRRYITDETVEIISKRNVMTTVGVFGHRDCYDTEREDSRYLTKFLYHGKRSLSTGIIGELDPDLEVGRVYYLSNDSIEYVNAYYDNRSKLTMARICDIPTRMEQLIGITDIAPTLIADQFYTRQGASYTFEDRDRLLQLINYGVLVHNSDHKYIGYDFPEVILETDDWYIQTGEDYERQAIDIMNQRFSYPYLLENYPRYKDLDEKLEVHKYIHMWTSLATKGILGYEWDIISGGSGYSTGSIIQVYLYGKMIQGKILKVSESGEILSIGEISNGIQELGVGDPESILYGTFDAETNQWYYKNTGEAITNRDLIDRLNEGRQSLQNELDHEEEMIEIPLSSIDSQYTYLTPSVVTSTNNESVGKGCVLEFFVTKRFWEKRGRTVEGVIPNLYTYTLDVFGNIWIWEFSEKLLDPDDEKIIEQAHQLFLKTNTRRENESHGDWKNRTFQSWAEQKTRDQYILNVIQNGMAVVDNNAIECLHKANPDSSIWGRYDLETGTWNNSLLQNVMGYKKSSVFYIEGWIRKYQMTGDRIVENPYDNFGTRRNRKLNAILTNHIHEYKLFNQGSMDYPNHPTSLFTKTEKIDQWYRYEYEDDESLNYQEHLMNVDISDKHVTPDMFYLTYNEEFRDPDAVYDNVVYMDSYESAKIQTDYMVTRPKTYYPMNHKAAVNINPNKAGNLIFNHITDGIYGKAHIETVHGNVAQQQPNVFMYDPFETEYHTYHQVRNDVVQIEETYPITFASFENSKSLVWEKNQLRLEGSAYRYTGYDLNGDDVIDQLIENKETTKSGVTYEDILTTAYNLYRTEYPRNIDESVDGYEQRIKIGWTEDVQKTYIKRVYMIIQSKEKSGESSSIVDSSNNLQFYYEDKCYYHPSIYDEPAIEMFRKPREIVATRDNKGNITPVGEQPCGTLKPITTQQYPSHYQWNNIDYQSKLVYLVKIPDDVKLELGSFDFCRVEDEYSLTEVDSEAEIIILYRNELYIRDSEERTWVKVLRE